MTSDNYMQRFGGLQRLYGAQGLALLQQLHICVVGIGGVGSWAVEALARTGVGRITMLDFDVIKISNINRQLHTLTETVDQKKFAVMADRIKQINPDCQCEAIDDFVTLHNLQERLAPEHKFDYVIDAIDRISIKAAMIHHCKRNKIPIVTVGGAGGITDPTQIQVADLSRTRNDALAAEVRAALRKDYGFTRNLKRTFGVECVFSAQQRFYPKDDGTVCHTKPGMHGVSLDCRFGYGSVSHVTAVFGFIAASRAINRALHRRQNR